MTAYAVEFIDDLWQVRTGPDSLAPVRNGGHPVSGFAGGWRALTVYAGFAPVFLLELVRDDGATATWYLDGSMNRIGGELHELTVDTRAHLVQRYREATDAPWDSLIVATAPVWPEVIDGLADVNSRTLAELDGLARGPDRAEFAWKDISGTDDLVLTLNDHGVERPVAVSPEHMISILSIDIRRHFILSMNAGRLTWPSPITGKPVTSVHGLYIDNMMILYRCVDEEHRLVYFVCCAGHDMETVGVLFPTIRRGFYLTPMQRHLAENACTNLMARTMHYITRNGRLLPDYFARDLRTFATPLWGGAAFHIGHHLWNELSGLMDIVTGVTAEAYPRIIVQGDPGDGEAYGEIGRLFPELASRVERGLRDDADMVEFCCKNAIQIVRVTDSYVSAGLRNRVNRLVRISPAVDKERILSERLRQDGTPVVVLGLRVENRTVVDCQSFCHRVVEHLQQRLGRVAVIIDGHNARRRDGQAESYPSFTEARAAEPPIKVEMRIAQSLQAAFKDSQVTIVDNIGGSMDASLFWLDRAAFFICPWGAGLAKYRWIANKPGVVVSSRWVLQNKGDIHIYDDPKYMEEPADIRFIAPKHVFDFAEEPVLVQVFHPHHPMYYNFKMSMRALYSEIDASIESAGL